MKEQIITKILIRKDGFQLEISGREGFVERKFEELLQEIESKDQKNDVIKSPIRKLVDNKKYSSEDTTLSEFIRSRNPKDNTERVAAFAYYLNKFKNKDQITNPEFKRCYKEINQAIPSNVSDVLKRASGAANGYLRKIKAGTWALTQTGEKFVESLPREKDRLLNQSIRYITD